MTSFGWKRKLGASVSKDKSRAFEENSKDEKSEGFEDVDWLTLMPNRKVICLEDPKSKCKRLVQEGAILVESERYWEAIKKWDEALQFNQNDEKILEMKAQVFMLLNELYPAVQSARKASQMKPNWWVAHQTCGRAFLGMGEVRGAIKSFSQAVHLNPAEEELWEDDLGWAVNLLKKNQEMKKSLDKSKQELKNGSCVIEELPGSTESSQSETDMTISHYKKQDIETETTDLVTFPKDYVKLRDCL